MRAAFRSMGLFQRLLLCVTLGCAFHPQTALSQITIGLLRSVNLLRFGDSEGTCFTMTVDGKRYLITAGHVVVGIKAGDKIGIYRGGDSPWEDFAVTPIRVGSPKIDIAVLISERPISVPAFASESGSTAGLNMLQEVYFLGFPYGGTRSVGGRTYRLFSNLALSGSSYPAPLLKRGIISGLDNTDPDSPIIFVDAMGNPGFSGSPLLFYDKASNTTKVLGVVSARIPEDLMTERGVAPPPASANSGIVVAHDISAAARAIRATKSP